MNLSLKNPETYRLARELALLTGKSMTEAVTEALRQRLNHLKKQREEAHFHEEVCELSRQFRSLLQEPLASHGDLLYDERGLPK